MDLKDSTLVSLFVLGFLVLVGYLIGALVAEGLVTYLGFSPMGAGMFGGMVFVWASDWLVDRFGSKFGWSPVRWSQYERKDV